MTSEGSNIDPGFSPEDEANFLSRLLFCWMTPLIKLGRQHPLQQSDLYPVANGLASGLQADRFEQGYERVISSEYVPVWYRWKGSNTFRALLREVLGLEYWKAALGKPIWLGAAIGQVFALRELVERVTRASSNDDGASGAGNTSIWVYFALSVVMFIAALAQGVAQSSVFYGSMKSGLKVQTAVSVSIYRKTLRLSLDSLGGSDILQGQMGNLLLNDSERLRECLSYFHFLWLGFVESLVLSALLCVELGLSALFSLPLLGLLLGAQFLFGIAIAKARKRGMLYSDSRVQTMGKVLQDMRSIKLNAWEPHFLKIISGKRQKELYYLLQANLSNAVNQAAFYSMPLFISLVMFAGYTLLAGKTLTPASVFSSLAFVNVLGRELTIIPQGFRTASEAVISLARLDRFFCLGEIQDRNLTSENLGSEHHGSSVAPVESPEMNRVSDDELSKLDAPQVRASIVEGEFEWNHIEGCPEVTVISEARPCNSMNVCCNGVEIVSGAHEQGEESNQGHFESTEEDGVSSKVAVKHRNSNIALRNVTFSVRDGMLVSIVGEVGSGKTSLLLAILGELHKIRGCSDTFGTISYCEQHPWIVNGTIRENITLFSRSERQFDEDLYERVIDACCLKPDIYSLSAGDQTEIGERGINLSGGQKARLALARAIYSDADLYLLDDPLSAVDAIVGKKLKDRVLGPQGILASKARVVVTHQLQLLPESNRIYMLDAGSILASGTLDELEARGFSFSNLGLDDVDVVSTTTDSHGRNVLRQDKRKRNINFDRYAGSNDSQDSEILESSKDEFGDARESSESDEKYSNADLTVREDRRVGRVAWPIYMEYTKAGGGYLAAGGVLAVYTLSQATRLVAEWWLSQWSEDGQNRIEDADPVNGNRFYVLIFMALTFGVAIFTLARASLFAYRVMHASKGIHNRLLNRIMSATPGFFESNPTGRLLNRFSRDIDQMDTFLPTAAQNFLNIAFIILGALVTISWILPWFLLALPILAALFWFLQHWYILSSRELKRLDGVSKSPAYALYTETMTGLLTVRAYAAQNKFQTIFQNRIDDNQRAYWQFTCAGRWIAVRLDVLSGCVVLATSIIIVSISSKLNPGLAGVALTQSLMMTGLFQWGVRQKTECENFFTSVERICAMTAEAPTEAPAIIPENRPDLSWPSGGVVEFNEVVLRYRPPLDPALKKLSFKTKPHERIGICGRTGAGKSSIFVALFRMIELSEGYILIDGIDISKIGLRDLRTALAIVPQEPVLFNGTIRMNIDPLGSHSDAKLWEALDRVHMRQSVNRTSENRNDGKNSRNLGHGLDLVVSDGGSNFSSGERQLLCLARVILSGSRVVVLDEATASIDSKTDGLIQEAVRKHLRNCTVITIAHRLDTIIDSDRILVMEDGVAVELDTPEKLLSSGGYFSKLVEETGAIESAELRRKILANTSR
eukprot:Plantae.Rhodophyta-Hildenbrandia_rubra.ctg2564.p1 GENE.Plantae.Rhodophyta-Hildenbrandia_rubra.ctg2564~~Plantae.Rhodophyta-Hildenbrandia_rubra.ctg2564.p1  ORF type:complete len:1432 (+),score=206.38 Plantae.Rhodophyta-Hildenbrandia_rubra.ctg2564:367-4662(+)